MKPTTATRQLLLAAALLFTTVAPWAQAQPASAPASAAAQTHPFTPIAAVLTHPRCLNCHQAEAPKQTDLGRRHAQGVLRGLDGHGAPTMRCSSCHQATNTSEGRVPGAKHWHLAPLSMSWQGLSASQICSQMKDPARNGNRRTGAQVIEHMASDPLVTWAWSPGAGRSQPPLSHPAFLEALKHWAQAGMPCPP